MTKSDTINELAAALAKAKTAFTPILKNADNPFFRSKYAPLEAVIEATDAALSANGLSVTQLPEAEGLTTLLLHNSGQFISSLYPIHPMKQVRDAGWVASDDPQSLGSAITYARRYALSAILGVASEPDDDGNAATEKKPTPAPTAKPAPAPAKTATAILADENSWAVRWAGYCIEAKVPPSEVEASRIDWQEQHFAGKTLAELLPSLLKTPDTKKPERVKWLSAWWTAKQELEAMK